MAKIPFNWLPASWGLKGKTRKVAEAEYYYTGYELDRQLILIEFDDHSSKECKRKLYDLDLKFEKITKDEHTRLVAKLDASSDTDYELSILDIELKNETITQTEYEKKRANILKEPWVSMPKINWDPNNKQSTFFELDYNDYFVQHLKDNGYTGNDDDIITQWLNDICISILEELNGMEADLATPSKRTDLDL